MRTFKKKLVALHSDPVHFVVIYCKSGHFQFLLMEEHLLDFEMMLNFHDTAPLIELTMLGEIRLSNWSQSEKSREAYQGKEE